MFSSDRLMGFRADSFVGRWVAEWSWGELNLAILNLSFLWVSCIAHKKLWTYLPFFGAFRRRRCYQFLCPLLAFSSAGNFPGSRYNSFIEVHVHRKRMHELITCKKDYTKSYRYSVREIVLGRNWLGLILGKPCSLDSLVRYKNDDFNVYDIAVSITLYLYHHYRHEVWLVVKRAGDVQEAKEADRPSLGIKGIECSRWCQAELFSVFYEWSKTTWKSLFMAPCFMLFLLATHLSIFHTCTTFRSTCGSGSFHASCFFFCWPISPSFTPFNQSIHPSIRPSICYPIQSCSSLHLYFPQHFR